MKEFPWEIKLDDHWFEYDYNKFKEAVDNYNIERRKLEDMEHEATAPIPCKSWIKDYFYGGQPDYQAKMWNEINDYINENEKKDGWTFVDLHKEQVDVNTDPYDEYENLTTKYTVYATVENDEDFRECEAYQTQYQYVQHLYNEAIKLKTRIDKKLKGEYE